MSHSIEITGTKSRRCSNVVFQRGQPGVIFLLFPRTLTYSPQPVEVKRGSVGLGAFSIQPIQENDYLGGNYWSQLFISLQNLSLHTTEYTGESYNDWDPDENKSTKGSVNILLSSILCLTFF
jgi:hypothetical protein